MAFDGKVYDLVLLQPPDFVSRTPTMYFPLSLQHLSAVVKEAGYSVKVLDCRTNIGRIPLARYYGFSCTTPHIEAAKRIATKVNGKTIVGGPHASLLPEDCLDFFDYTVVGEGEYAILDILSGKVKPGIVEAPRIQDLNGLPAPDRDCVEEPFSRTLFPGERYGEGPLAATTIFSRGCPGQCAFCGNIFRTPVVFRNVDSIIKEMRCLLSKGVRHFRVEDDNMSLHPQLEELCGLLHNLDMRFKAHTRSDLVTKEKMELLHWAGCEEMGVGVESADDDVLQLVRKRESATTHRKACQIIKQSGMRLKTYFMTGLPGEDLVTIKLNKRFMTEVKPHKWTLSRFTAYPGCEIWHKPQEFGIRILDTDFNHFWNFPGRSTHELDNASVEELDRRYKELLDFMLSEVWRR